MPDGCTSHSYLKEKIAFCTETLYIEKNLWGLQKFGITSENIISSKQISSFSSTLSSNKNLKITVTDSFWISCMFT